MALLDKFRKQWRQEKEQVVVEPVLQSAAPEPPSPLRKPMSFSFNQAATNAAVQTPVVEMEQSPKL